MFAFGSRMASVSTADLQARLEKGEKLTVVDVREGWEYGEGHVPGSLHRPLGQIQRWAAEFDKNAEIFVICRTGARSGSAYQYMQSLGFKNVHNVSGGIISWRGAVER